MSLCYDFLFVHIVIQIKFIKSAILVKIIRVIVMIESQRY